MASPHAANAVNSDFGCYKRLCDIFQACIKSISRLSIEGCYNINGTVPLLSTAYEKWLQFQSTSLTKKFS